MKFKRKYQEGMAPDPCAACEEEKMQGMDPSQSQNCMDCDAMMAQQGGGMAPPQGGMSMMRMGKKPTFREGKGSGCLNCPDVKSSKYSGISKFLK